MHPVIGHDLRPPGGRCTREGHAHVGHVGTTGEGNGRTHVRIGALVQGHMFDRTIAEFVDVSRSCGRFGFI